jgi:hypothetical protein
MENDVWNTIQGNVSPREAGAHQSVKIDDTEIGGRRTTRKSGHATPLDDSKFRGEWLLEDFTNKKRRNKIRRSFIVSWHVCTGRGNSI